ncbi:hypothetical protein [Leptolyngbya sp. KIOST-1]|uniref:hypothetical protein n=1 Tax=Leptolyngbya sp. KIOST-1 TaxID=1229172 RepID=UPI00055DE486|nr:hypothetical protein [Leptolyngbya sp. KIOST-1]
MSPALSFSLSSAPARRVLTALHWLLATFPLLLLVSLWGMTARAAQLLGTFPRPFVNDPYQFGADDRPYRAWAWLVAETFNLTALSWLPWLGLVGLTLWCQRRYWSKRGGGWSALPWLVPVGLYVLAHLALIFDPTGRVSWYLD